MVVPSAITLRNVVPVGSPFWVDTLDVCEYNLNLTFSKLIMLVSIINGVFQSNVSDHPL